MDKTIRNIAVDKTLAKLQVDIDTNPNLEELIDLSDDDQSMVIGILNQAFKNVVRDTILKEDDLTLPYIGIIKIKRNNRLALKFKKEIANNFGYTDFKLIPKDKLVDAEKQVRELVKLAILEQKAKGINKRVSHQKKPKSSPKVLQFDMANVKKKVENND